MGIDDRIAADRPKKLLALDGGGIRGIISIEILDAIERVVGAPLSDYFDYVAGTSTGAILAACISLGMSVDQIRRFYVSAGPRMFSRAVMLDRLRYAYEDDALADMLKTTFAAFDRGSGELTLGSDALKTLLLLVLRNATTDSPWPLSNNPRAMFNDRARHDCNLELPLWKLVRASTAAPTYFPPERIRIGRSEFLFVDGGVSTYNNPAFLLFLQATTDPYRLCWRTGPHKLLLVSVGTGATAQANPTLGADDMNILYNARSVPSALIHASLIEQDVLCRVFGRCLHGARLDLELGDLRWSPDNAIAGLPKLFTYLRYTADLTRDGLDRLDLPGVVPEAVQKLDSIDHIADLTLVGQAAAREVDPAHFDGFLGRTAR